MPELTLNCWYVTPSKHEIDWGSGQINFFTVEETDGYVEDFTIDFVDDGHEPVPSNTGYVESHNMRPPHREAHLSVKLFAEEKMAQFAALARTAQLAPAMSQFSSWPESFSQAGVCFFQHLPVNAPFTQLTEDELLGSAVIRVQDNGPMNPDVPWYVVSADERREPRWHYFAIQNQVIVGSTRDLTISPPLILDFGRYSLVRSFFGVNSAVITDSEISEGYSGDMQYWRFRAHLREVWTTWRFREVPP